MLPFTAELFESDVVSRAVAASGVGHDPTDLHQHWEPYINRVLSDATLVREERTWTPTGGRRGLHSERFGYMLAEMQHLHRSFPGATW